MEFVEEGNLYSIEGNIHFTYKQFPDMSSLCKEMSFASQMK